MLRHPPHPEEPAQIARASRRIEADAQDGGGIEEVPLTKVVLDTEQVELAFALSGERPKKVAVTKALEEFIACRGQRRLIELFGKLEWNSAYDQKAERSRN